MTWQKLTRPNYSQQIDSKRVSMSINPWPMLFGRYLAGNSVFWHIYVRKKFFQVKKSKKIDFLKIGLNHICMFIMHKKHVQRPLKAIFMPYIHIIATTWPYIKNQIFGKNRDFHEFWHFLINRYSADWPAGSIRNDYSWSETYSRDTLEAFSYTCHHCISLDGILWLFENYLNFPSNCHFSWNGH